VVGPRGSLTTRGCRIGPRSGGRNRRHCRRRTAGCSRTCTLATSERGWKAQRACAVEARCFDCSSRSGGNIHPRHSFGGQVESQMTCWHCRCRAHAAGSDWVQIGPRSFCHRGLSLATAMGHGRLVMFGDLSGFAPGPLAVASVAVCACVLATRSELIHRTAVARIQVLTRLRRRTSRLTVSSYERLLRALLLAFAVAGCGVAVAWEWPLDKESSSSQDVRREIRRSGLLPILRVRGEPYLRFAFPVLGGRAPRVHRRGFGH